MGYLWTTVDARRLWGRDSSCVLVSCEHADRASITFLFNICHTKIYVRMKARRVRFRNIWSDTYIKVMEVERQEWLGQDLKDSCHLSVQYLSERWTSVTLFITFGTAVSRRYGAWKGWIHNRRAAAPSYPRDRSAITTRASRREHLLRSVTSIICYPYKSLRVVELP